MRNFINTPAESVQKVYEAYYNINGMLRDPKYQLQYKLEEGDVLVFDNNRILHGRTSFDSQTSSRLLHGLYLDWDNIKSTLRVLRKKTSSN